MSENKDILFDKLIKYDFNLCREDNAVHEILEQHLKEYVKDLNECLKETNTCLNDEFKTILNEKIEFIEDICNRVVYMSKLYREGNIRESYEKSEKVFDDLSEYFTCIKLSSDCIYYRIRKGDDIKKKKSELFHIIDKRRNLINSYRYSILGFPCLYLAEGCELAWFECGMPSQFSYCEMKVEKDKFTLIDFTEQPHNLKINIINSIINLENNKNIEEKKRTYHDLLRYIITYPLVISCSLKVEKRDDVFVEEYVIPQMLMQWVKNCNKFDGIRYKSSLNANLVNGFGANNIVLVVEDFREDGLDKKLAENIRISDIGYFNVNEYFEKVKEDLKNLIEFKNKLKLGLSKTNKLIYTVMYKQYIQEIEQICDVIDTTYTALIRGNYSRYTSSQKKSK